MTVLRAAVPLLVLGVLGCSSHDDDHGNGSGSCTDGTYLLAGEVTDEACLAFVDAESRGQIVTDATKAPTFTAPKTGDKVPAAPPPRFAWTKGTLALTPWKRLLRAIDPIGVAWAHGVMTGDVAVLEFRDASKKEVYRVLTSGTEFTPDTATWDRIRASGALEVTLVGVRFAQNAIASGTRPTTGDVLKITVQ